MICNGCWDWFTRDSGSTGGWAGDAGGKCLDVRKVFGDALIRGLPADIIVAACGWLSIMPHGEGDVAVGIQGKECVDAFPGFGDIMRAAKEVV